jgi:hypothetical protein
MSPWSFNVLLVGISSFSKAQLIMSLYAMSDGRVAILWSFDFSMTHKWLSESLRECFISWSRFSEICLHYLIELITCGVVSNMTSPSGLEISVVSSLILGPFFGAISFILETKRCHKKEVCKLGWMWLIPDRKSENKVQNTDL